MRSIGRSIAAAAAVWTVAVLLAGALPLLPASAAGEKEPLVVKVDDGGFRWRDAGIGAVGALAVVLLCAGVALTVRARRGEQAR